MDLIVSLDNGLFTRYDDRIQHFVENRMNRRCEPAHDETLIRLVQPVKTQIRR